jgi:hypothetical protein
MRCFTPRGAELPMKAAEKVLTLPSLAGHKGNETFEVWRRVRDSNPRYPSGYAGFQDRCHQPLGQLSVTLFSHHFRRTVTAFNRPCRRSPLCRRVCAASKIAAEISALLPRCYLPLLLFLLMHLSTANRRHWLTCVRTHQCLENLLQS